MRLGLLVELLAFVTLEMSLLSKLLRLSAESTIVTVCKLPLVTVADGIPSRADVDSACYTYLATWDC